MVASHAAISARRLFNLLLTRSNPLLPRIGWAGGAGDYTAAMIASAARAGSPGCLPLPAGMPAWRLPAPAS